MAFYPSFISTGNTITHVAAAAITANTVAMAGTRAVFYPRAAAAGDTVSGLVACTELEIEKTTQSTTYTLGAAVNLDTATQKTVSTGGSAIGFASKPSTANDKTVFVRINE